jgi:hypothetical protein
MPTRRSLASGGSPAFLRDAGETAVGYHTGVESHEDGESRRKASFLVSFWIEPGRDGSADGAWRGSVEHIRSGERLYFNQISILVGFLSGWLSRRRR